MPATTSRRSSSSVIRRARAGRSAWTFCLEVEDEPRIGLQVRVPVAAARRAAQVDPAVDLVEPRLDPPRLPATAPCRRDVDRPVALECSASLRIHPETLPGATGWLIQEIVLLGERAGCSGARRQAGAGSAGLCRAQAARHARPRSRATRSWHQPSRLRVRGRRRRRDPGPRLPDREAANDARCLPAVAERAPARLQPVHEPRPGGRLRRADDPAGARAARPQALGATRERRRQPRRQVPASARRDALARRRGNLAAGRAHAARPADAGRAQAALGAAAPVRLAGRRRGDVAAARRARARAHHRPASRPEGGPLGAAPRGGRRRAVRCAAHPGGAWLARRPRGRARAPGGRARGAARGRARRRRRRRARTSRPGTRRSRPSRPRGRNPTP